jgi:hypothetical protein
MYKKEQPAYSIPFAVNEVLNEHHPTIYGIWRNEVEYWMDVDSNNV